MNMARKFKLSPNVLFQEVSGETVLLDLNTESYFGLDDVGTRIWQLLPEKENLQGVFDAVLQEYDVQPAKLEADMDELLQQLLESGLIA